MKLGVNLINFGPGVRPESLEQWTRVAENLGYHFIAISDHVAVTADVAEQYPAPFYDPFMTLAWLAGITKEIELATTVIILPYRNPLQVARLTANLDRFSGGRFILGVGAGWARQEFEALGLPFHERGRMTDECLEAIRRLWTQDVASFEGRHVRFRDVHTAPRPLRSPHPPIWVGGNSEAALSRTLRLGNAWHPINLRISWLEQEGIPRLREMAEKQGRSQPDVCPRLPLQITERPLGEDERRAGQGTLEQIHQDLARLEKLGCPYVLLDLFTGDIEATRHHEPFWRTLRIVAEQLVDLAQRTLR